MKSINMKRLCTLILAGVLALSLAAPAFAADTVITGGYEEVDLDVTISETGKAIVNPYGLPVDLKASDDTTIQATITKEQVTTAAPLTIVNASAVALSVSAKVTGTETGDAKLVPALDANVTETSTPKNIVARLEVFAAPGIVGADFDAIEGSDATAKDAALAKLNKAFAALKSDDAPLTAPVLTTASISEGELILRAGKDGAAQDGSVAFFRLAGEVVKNPTTDWAEASGPVAGDGFTATIAFTFEPSEYVGTVELKAPASVGAGSTATVTVDMPAGVKAVYDTIKWESSAPANVTVADATTAPAEGATDVTAVSGTLTGAKAGNTAATITLEFEGDDGIIYRGTAQVKCG